MRQRAPFPLSCYPKKMVPIVASSEKATSESVSRILRKRAPFCLAEGKHRRSWRRLCGTGEKKMTLRIHMHVWPAWKAPPQSIRVATNFELDKETKGRWQYLLKIIHPPNQPNPETDIARHKFIAKRFQFWIYTARYRGIWVSRLDWFGGWGIFSRKCYMVSYCGY